MRFEIVIFAVAAFLMANIYTDGKYTKLLFSWKKYYQMAAVALGALFLYYILKKNPLQARELVVASNEYIKYLPLDRNTTSMISPILDFTAKQNFRGDDNHPVVSMSGGVSSPSIYGRTSLMKKTVTTTTKRSVSETKKKFVASRQQWKCGDCQQQLNAWFEIDHIKRLEFGGDNHIDNLVALCRECHGKKTTIENL